MLDIYQESMNRIRQVYADSHNELNSMKIVTKEDMEKVEASTTRYMQEIYKEVEIQNEGFHNICQHEGHCGRDADTELAKTIALAEMKYINELLFVLGALRRTNRLALKEMNTKVLSPELDEYCEESDFVEYVGRKSNGDLVLVSDYPDALSIKLREKGFAENEIYGIVFQDSVNTCPQCGVLYYIEDLIQLEDDIICESCHNQKHEDYTCDGTDEDGWVLLTNEDGNGSWINVVNGVLIYANMESYGRDKESEGEVTAPETQVFLNAVNEYFGTAFKLEYFDGR